MSSVDLLTPQQIKSGLVLSRWNASKSLKGYLEFVFRSWLLTKLTFRCFFRMKGLNFEFPVFVFFELFSAGEPSGPAANIGS